MCQRRTRRTSYVSFLHLFVLQRLVMHTNWKSCWWPADLNPSHRSILVPVMTYRTAGHNIYLRYTDIKTRLVRVSWDPKVDCTSVLKGTLRPQQVFLHCWEIRAETLSCNCRLVKCSKGQRSGFFLIKCPALWYLWFSRTAGWRCKPHEIYFTVPWGQYYENNIWKLTNFSYLFLF